MIFNKKEENLYECAAYDGISDNKFKFAFTLSEVLITLGIIGIVAAMTLPSLVAKYKEKQRVTQLKKAYSVLNQAFMMAVNDYGTPDNWGLVKTDTGEVDEEGNAILDNSGSEKALSILKKYIKYRSMKNGEIIGYVSSLDGRQAFWPWEVSSDKYTYIADGTVLAQGWIHADNACPSGNCGDFWVVFPSRNMRIGVDVFNFLFTTKGFVPNGMPEYRFKNLCNMTKTSVAPDQQGRGCSAWVVFNGNMDYLHCNDLSWEGKSSCK